MEMVGEPVELYARHESPEDVPPYQRLIGDATEGDQILFAREDTVEAAWRIVDPVLDHRVPVLPYERGSWGPAKARDFLPEGDCWHDPKAEPVST